MSPAFASQPQLSREELLRQWQERKRTKPKKERPLSPKKVKVRVRRSHPTAANDPALRLYEQGTVASRLKSKHLKQNPATRPSGRSKSWNSCEPERRKLEPNQSHETRHADDKDKENENENEEDDYSTNVLIIAHIEAPVSPLSCSYRSAHVGSPTSTNIPRHPRYYTMIERGIDHNESIASNSISSQSPVGILEGKKDLENSKDVTNITKRSKSQRSITLPSYNECRDDFDLEDRSHRSLLSGVVLPGSPSQRERVLSFESDQEDHLLDNLWLKQSNDFECKYLDESKEKMRLETPPKHYSDLNSGEENHTHIFSLEHVGNDHEKEIDDINKDVSAESRAILRSTPSQRQPRSFNADYSDGVYQTENQSPTPQQAKGPGAEIQWVNEKVLTETTHERKDQGHELNEDSFDWRNSRSPDTPPQRRSFVNQTLGRLSSSGSQKEVSEGTTQYPECDNNDSEAGTNKHMLSDDDIDEDSFDWRHNLSPDTPPRRQSSISVRRRKESLLILSRSPLDRFRRGRHASLQADPMSSSLDSEFDIVADGALITEEDSHGETDGSSMDSALHENDEDSNPQQILVADTFVQVEGKTVLQPVREELIQPSDLHHDEKMCLCSCCTSRDAQVETLRLQLEELQWRAETAEVDKQKSQNQIYAIRKKYEMRVTPFRDIFDEVGWIINNVVCDFTRFVVLTAPW